METVDIAVIGAGVLGLAAAARMASKDRTVVVLEQASRYGTGTSSRNSEVVHAGIYYPPGSIKSRLCHAGRRSLYALGRESGIFIRKTGKYIVATSDEESGRLEKIKANAEESGAEGLLLVDGKDVSQKLPMLRIRSALWSPETGIIDSEDLMGHYFRKAEDRGAMFLFKSPATGIEPNRDGFTVAFGRQGESLQARWIVNAAGLFSDKVAQMAGIDIDEAGYRIHWCAGRYFRYKKDLALPCPVYPVPVTHGLGIHLTPDRKGRVRLGPDTNFISTLDYDVTAGLAGGFAEAARRYWPGLREEDIEPDTVGIRPKLTGPAGGFKDFILAEESARGLPGLINLIGIESPGLTASPAIADAVASMIE